MIRRTSCAVLIGACFACAGGSGAPLAAPPFPARPAGAAGAAELVEELAGSGLASREERLVEEILSGNVPEWLRSSVPVVLTGRIAGREHRLELRVLPDYLAVGSDDDFMRVPLSPGAAQRIADRMQMSLPTPLIVDAVWRAAGLRLEPAPIPPSDAMTTLPVFRDHHALIEEAWPASVRRGTLVAGIKKDVVLSARLDDAPGRVAIYGWHHRDGTPIQPVYVGHTEEWVDYSHGIRLVERRAMLDGAPVDLVELLLDRERAHLVSGEGPLIRPRYPRGGAGRSTR